MVYSLFSRLALGMEKIKSFHLQQNVKTETHKLEATFAENEGNSCYDAPTHSHGHTESSGGHSKLPLTACQQLFSADVGEFQPRQISSSGIFAQI